MIHHTTPHHTTLTHHTHSLTPLHSRTALNHVKKLRQRNEAMSDSFIHISGLHESTLSDSEGEWVAPQYDLDIPGLPHSSVEDGWDSGEDADTELAAAADTSRRRAMGTKWEGTMRQR